MADFKTHITTSSTLGVGMGAGAFFVFGFPLDQCMLSAALCGLSGMLPDLDSPNSVPVRETVAFSAAIIPMFLLHRFQHYGLTPEQMVLASAAIYFGIRFGVAEIFNRYTVHRGMWHSIPAALIAALLALLICTCEVLEYRLFKAVAVFAGFLSHLILDEIYSIDLSGAKIRVKKSSGTALKLFGTNAWANFSTYSKLGLLLIVVSFDPMVMNAMGLQATPVPTMAQQWLGKYLRPFETHDRHLHPNDQHESNSLTNGTFSNATTIPAANSAIPAAPGSFRLNEQTSPTETQFNFRELLPNSADDSYPRSKKFFH